MHDLRRLQFAIDRFDAENSKDPNREMVDGISVPRELLYARRMTNWLSRLAPDASEALQLAARSQHIRRWEIPRSNYPMDRAGYHRWRTDLGIFHAETAGRILLEVGCEPETIARVQSLIRKQQLKTDPDAQLLEDVICLVFLQFYFHPFARQHDEQKLMGILRRTWKKMSALGHAEALKLPLHPDARKLIEKALS
jgi:hypothetical protein